MESDDIFREYPTSLSDALYHLAQLSKLKNIPEEVLHKLTSDYAYYASSLKDHSSFIEQTFEGKNIHEKMSIFVFLATFSAQVIHDGYARKILPKLIEDLKKLTSENLLTSISQENLITFIEHGMHVSNEGFLPMNKLSNEDFRSSEALLRKVRPLPKEGDYMPSQIFFIAKDRIGAFDDAGNIHAISEIINQDDLPKDLEEIIPTSYLQHFEKALEKADVDSSHIKEAFYRKSTQPLFEKLLNENRLDALSALLAHIAIPEKEVFISRWQEFAQEKASALKIMHEIMLHAEVENQKASAEFVEYMRKLCTPSPRFLSQNILDNLFMEDAEIAFSAAENIALLGKYASHGDDERFLEANKLFHDLQELHERNFTKAREDEVRLRQEINERLKTLLPNLADGISEIFSESGRLAVKKSCQEARAEDPRKKVIFSSLTSQETINELPPSVTKNLPLLQELHRPETRRSLEKLMGINLTDLTLREQVQLLTFLAEYPKDVAIRACHFIERHGSCAAKTFLTREEKPEFIGQLLTYLEKLPHSDQHQIFLQYAHIAEISQLSAKSIAEQVFTKPEERLREAERLRISILANALPSEQTLAEGNLANLLSDQTKASGIFALLCKYAKEEHRPVAMSELQHAQPVFVSSATMLTKKERREILTIARENWEEQKPEIADFILNGLERALSQETTSLFLLRYQKEVLGFVRFDKREDGTLYGASLNVTKKARGSGIGELALHAAIEYAAKFHTIVADVFPELPVGMLYVESFGCVVTGVEELQVNNHTSKRLLLERDNEKNAKYHRDLHPDHGTLVTLPKGHSALDLIKAFENHTQKGMVATRYFSASPGEKTIFFEKRLTPDVEPTSKDT